MSTNAVSLWLAPLVVGVAMLVGCSASPQKPATDEAPAEETATNTDEEDDAARQAAERERQQAHEEQTRRLDALARDVEELRVEAEPVRSSLGGLLREELEELGNGIAGARSELERLGSATLDGWKAARTELTTTLDGLEDRIERATERLQGQKDVLARRREAERKPITGLFEGLDGGDYEAYRVSVVRDVQRALRERGYYPGPVDGYLGKPTMQALAAFQRDHALVATGVPTPKTRKGLIG